MKTFTDLATFKKSKELRRKNLSNCDLSNLDLSGYSPNAWKKFTFDHTDFSNTKIRFNPSQLSSRYCQKRAPYASGERIPLEYCNFTGCDLSHLKTSDFDHVSITGSNFTDTNLNIDVWSGYGEDIPSDSGPSEYRDYHDVIFPKNEKMYDGIDKVAYLGGPSFMIRNRHVPFSSASIYKTLCEFISKEYPINQWIKPKERYIVTRIIDLLLEIDQENEGLLYQLWSELAKASSFSEREKIAFFGGQVYGKEISSVDFSEIPVSLLNACQYQNCNFEQISFPIQAESMEWRTDQFTKCNTPKVILPTVTPSSWQENLPQRIGSSKITFQKNLYLELDRVCNGKCPFCRNQFLPSCTYDLDKIIYNLSHSDTVFDFIFVGGGEPMLFVEDLKRLHKETVLKNPKTKWVIITNASASFDELLDISKDFYINISRHNLDDKDNNQIFGLQTLSLQELNKLSQELYTGEHKAPLTLSITCFSGKQDLKGKGMNTSQKILDYVIAVEPESMNVIFQTMHEDLKPEDEKTKISSIDPRHFDDAIARLQQAGYKISTPIYSTGNYKITIAKTAFHTFSFKQYITEEQLQEKWKSASKRCFDLSMDPSGTIYSGWNPNTGKVLVKK